MRRLCCVREKFVLKMSIQNLCFYLVVLKILNSQHTTTLATNQAIECFICFYNAEILTFIFNIT